MKGLVLEGGGAKGSYQIGAVKALYEMGFEFDGITGTSIGAINGAFLAQGDFELIYDIWDQAEISLIIDTDKEALAKILDFQLKKETISKSFNYLRDVLHDGGLDISPLKKLLEKHIDEEKIRKSSIDYGLVTVSVSDMTPLELFIEDITKGDLVKYILASASLPIFQLERFRGKFFLDGGFYDNQPVNLLASKGYKDIVVLETNGIGRKRNLKYDDLKLLRISPNCKISRTLEVDKEKLKRNIRLGYLDAYKAVKGYYGFHYYFDIEADEQEVLSYLISLSKEKKQKIGSLFNIREKITNRIFFEVCIPVLGKILKEPEEADYMQLISSLHEKMAEICEIDPLKVYSLEEIRTLIIDSLDFTKEVTFDDKFYYIPFKFLPKEIDLLPKKTLKKMYQQIFKILYL